MWNDSIFIIFLCYWQTIYLDEPMTVEAGDIFGIHTSNLPHPLYAESDQRGPSASPRSNICGLGTTVLPRVFVFGNYHDEIIGANFNTTPPTGGKVLWGGGGEGQ